MPTIAVDSATAALANPTPTDRGMDSLKSEDFFRILITELQNQDPLKPTETADMIGQVSDIRSIELSKQLTDVLSQMANQQRTSGASEFLGKYVIASLYAADGAEYLAAGVVTGVSFGSDGRALLELDTGESVLASDVTHVTSVENAERMLALETSDESEESEDSKSSTQKSKSTQEAQAEPTGPLTWLGRLLGL
jgi:flagellar basal-body rod modification protein FlgD